MPRDELEDTGAGLEPGQGVILYQSVRSMDHMRINPANLLALLKDLVCRSGR